MSKNETTIKQIKNRAYPTVDGYDNFLSRLGLNNDNALSAGTYTFDLITRNRVLLEAAYRGSWIVGTVVDSVAEDMTREGIEIFTSDLEDIKVFEKANTRLKIQQSMCTGLKWGRLYGGALGLIQIKGQRLDTPLDLETVAKDQFQGIAIFDRWMLNPVLNEIIDSGPDMGLPVFYQITSTPNQSSPAAPTPTGQVTVHHSRVIRFIGIELPFFQAITEMMWGESSLERIWDRLITYDNATLSAAQLIDRANLRVIGIDGYREIIALGGEAVNGLEASFEKMRLLQVNMGLTIIDKEDNFFTDTYTFAGLSDMLLQFAQQLSGATGIPLVRLFSQTPTGMNATGESDVRMYYDNIKAWQEAKLRNAYETILRVQWRSTFGKPAPDDLDFEFVPLWQMSALDKATIAKSNTETVLGAYEGGLVSQKTAMEELKDASGETGLFSNITDKEINQADEEMAPMPDENVVTPTEPAVSLKPKTKTGDGGGPLPLKPHRGFTKWLLGR